MVRGRHHGQDHFQQHAVSGWCVWCCFACAAETERACAHGHLQQHAVSGWRAVSGRRGAVRLCALLRCFWRVGMECACAESSSATCCQCSPVGIRLSALGSLHTTPLSISAPSLLAADHAQLLSPVHWPAACTPTPVHQCGRRLFSKSTCLLLTIICSLFPLAHSLHSNFMSIEHRRMMAMRVVEEANRCACHQGAVLQLGLAFEK